MKNKNIIIAIRFTPYFARTIGWGIHFNKVCGVLGFGSHYPTPETFVQAVYKWQLKNPPLKADGILGPITWSKLQPRVSAYIGSNTFVGPHPEWVLNIAPEADSSVSSKRNNPAPVRTISTDDESRVIKEMAAVAIKQKSNTYVAVPVSGAFAAAQGFPRGVSRDFTGLPLTQWLEVGQKWEGIAGPRIVVGLSGGGSLGSVIFVTESGQAYDQSVIGWESDLFAKLYSDVAKKLAPIKLMLDIEASFLLGAISASGIMGTIIVAAGNVTQFILENREFLTKAINIIDTFLTVRKVMLRIAPTLYDKVFWLVMKKILAGIPESASNNPKIIARFVGELLVKIGKTIWVRDFKIVKDLLGVLSKVVMAALRATPGAVKNAFDSIQLVEELKRLCLKCLKRDHLLSQRQQLNTLYCGWSGLFGQSR